MQSELKRLYEEVGELRTKLMKEDVTYLPQDDKVIVNGDLHKADSVPTPDSSKEYNTNPDATDGEDNKLIVADDDAPAFGNGPATSPTSQRVVLHLPKTDLVPAPDSSEGYNAKPDATNGEDNKLIVADDEDIKLIVADYGAPKLSNGHVTALARQRVVLHLDDLSNITAV